MNDMLNKKMPSLWLCLKLKYLLLSDLTEIVQLLCSFSRDVSILFLQFVSQHGWPGAAARRSHVDAVLHHAWSRRALPARLLQAAATSMAATMLR